ncbi:MAG: SDR family oxidoreductase [Flavobacteriaceae bacterium]|nr:SDR family oxidoreductase [Flavobacteriaceae bacterium]MDG2315051.1 SDR family oxidoreductase [Flavobacteriaceae bacterium]
MNAAETKVILITGGSSGIGKSIGNLLLSKGYTVYGTSRNPTKYPNSTFPLLPLDVALKDQINAVVKEIHSKEGRIDVLINNAGIGITGPVEETPHEEILKAFSVNFFGPIDMIKAVLPYMRAQYSGLIINITSIAGYMGLPYRGIYSATKSALEVITESLRAETKDFGIRIANLAPGDFATDIAQRRFHAPVIKGSPYEHSYQNTLQLINQHVDKGLDPIKVAKAVVKIMNQQNPKIHYKTGSFFQKFSIVLKRILPDSIFERLIFNHHNL